MKKLDYSKGAVPLYMQIYQDLKDKIKNREYEYGQTIPSEQELQAYYDVSRITVRQALGQLEQGGLVVRSRGRGTVVSRQNMIEESLAAIRSFTDEMRDRDMVPGTSFVSVDQVEADEKLAEIFSCEVGSPLYLIRRVRTANERPIVLFETYLPGRFEMPLETGRYYGSLYKLLNELGISPPVSIEERFEAIVAAKDLAETLGILPGAPIMKRTRVSFNQDADVLEYTLSFYDATRYSYIHYAGTPPKTVLPDQSEPSSK